MICKSKKIKIIVLKFKVDRLYKKRSRELNNLAISNPGKFSRSDSFESNFPEVFEPIDVDIAKTKRLIKILKFQN